MKAVIIRRAMQRDTIVLHASGRVAPLLDDVISIRVRGESQSLAFDPEFDGQLIGQSERRGVRHLDVVVGAIEAEGLANCPCREADAVEERAIMFVAGIIRIALSRPPTYQTGRGRRAPGHRADRLRCCKQNHRADE